MDLTGIGGPEYASRANGPAASDPAEIPALDRRGEYSTGAQTQTQQTRHVRWPYNAFFALVG